MDEPTASLAEGDVARLMAIVRRLRDRGVGIVYVSHRLREIFALANRVTVLRDGAWLRHATHANAMAARLESRLRPLAPVQILFPRQANAVFAELPRPVIDGLRQRGWRFYTFIGQGGCRLMSAWDTTEADVDAFVADLKAVL